MKIILAEKFKWISTGLVLSGIFLTNLNIYPINIFLHGAGVLGWTTAAIITKDKPVLVNFGLQIPLFLIGYYNFFL
tara:strand:+ start:734 stop:961 length:228 start_codon:yes stop_codon:yes gene_type:complete